jgi:hypothetical protein
MASFHGSVEFLYTRFLASLKNSFHRTIRKYDDFCFIINVLHILIFCGFGDDQGFYAYGEVFLVTTSFP